MFGGAGTNEVNDLDALETAIDRLRHSDEVHDLARLRQLSDRLESVWVTNAGRYDRRGDWALEGFVNSASSIRAKCRMQQGHAHAVVRLAHKLESLPKTAAAFEAGEVSRTHVEVIANACTAEREVAIVELEATLVDVARLMVPGELRNVLRGITDALDGDGGAAEDEAQLARRRLHLSKTLDGMHAIDGLADGEDGETIAKALNALMERDRDPGETRTRPQRRMDALAEMARQWLRANDDSSMRRDRGHLSAIFDLAAYEHISPDAVQAARAEYANGGRLSHATIERMLCDCQVTRIVTDGPSAILDLGFPTKVVPDTLWRALVARDRHCTHPGCDRPASWCDAHHVIHRPNGGPTALHNLVLLCRRHHRLRHLKEAHRTDVDTPGPRIDFGEPREWIQVE